MTTLNQRPNRKDMYWGAEGDLGGYMLTAKELERATAKSDQSGYDLYTADQLSPEEIASATTEYHMEQDLSAMAARIDHLLAENDQLKRRVEEMAITLFYKGLPDEEVEEDVIFCDVCGHDYDAQDPCQQH